MEGSCNSEFSDSDSANSTLLYYVSTFPRFPTLFFMYTRLLLSLVPMHSNCSVISRRAPRSPRAADRSVRNRCRRPVGEIDPPSDTPSGSGTTMQQLNK